MRSQTHSVCLHTHTQTLTHTKRTAERYVYLNVHVYSVNLFGLTQLNAFYGKRFNASAVFPFSLNHVRLRAASERTNIRYVCICRTIDERIHVTYPLESP